MLDCIWGILMAFGIFLGLVRGDPQAVTNSMLRSAEGAITLTIGLVGVIALWTGVMRVAQEAGLPGFLARHLHPLLGKLFPSIPHGHPSLGAIALAFSANLLGLGNAATPLGLQAMQELQKLNPDPETVSPAQSTFLCLVIGGLTLVPATVIALRVRFGSRFPQAILAPTILATLMGTLTSLAVDRVAGALRARHAARGDRFGIDRDNTGVRGLFSTSKKG